jgi:hypothetical protein
MLLPKPFILNAQHKEHVEDDDEITVHDTDEVDDNQNSPDSKKP